MSNTSVLQNTIKKIKRDNQKRLIKIERHQRRMRRLQERKTEHDELIRKLEAWEPYLQSDAELSLLLEVVSERNAAVDQEDLENSKLTLQRAFLDFTNKQISVENLIAILEGKGNNDTLGFVNTPFYIVDLCALDVLFTLAEINEPMEDS